jgi:hypothetical protein
VSRFALSQHEVISCNLSLNLVLCVCFLDSCEATNLLTKKSRRSAEGHLQVIPKSPFTRPPQFISVSSPMIETRAGANVTLDCAAIGSPLPELIWTFLPRVPDGKLRPITNATRNGLNVVTVHHVTPEHSGIYTCTEDVARDKQTTPITQVSSHFGSIAYSAYNHLISSMFSTATGSVQKLASD